MKQTTIALYLKIFSIMTALIGGIFFFWYLPHMISDLAFVYPEAAFLKEPAMISLFFIAILCYSALFQFWKICSRISQNNSFCQDNAHSMFCISLFAGIVLLMIIFGTIFLMIVGFLNAAWFFVCFFTAFVAAGMCMICYALSKLIENAARIQEENDLTI